MFVDYDYSTLLEDFYADGSLRLESIFKILVNAGNFHSDLVGDNLLQGTLNGYAWIVTDWYAEILDSPKYGEKIHVKTWIHSEGSLFGGDRNSEIYTDGKLCVKAVQKLVLLDMKTNSPTADGKKLMATYKPELPTVFEQKILPRITTPNQFVSEVWLKPRRNDIDYNHHVHNVYYFDYAMEALPENVYENHNFKKIRVKYKQAIREGEELKIRYVQQSHKHIVCIFGNEEKLKTVMEFE